MIMCDDVRGLSPDECRDYIEMRVCVQPGTVPLAWSPSAQAPVCVGPESGRWTLAGREIPPDAVAEVWRAICRDHGITSDEIAARIGVHPRTVGWWRVGRIPVHAAREMLDWLASRAPGD